MTQRNQQHTDLNSENRPDAEAGLRAGFNGASRDPALIRHNIANPTAADLLLRTVAGPASPYSPLTREEKEREQFEKQLDRAILSAQNINHALFEQNLREINQRIDANLSRSCTSFRDDARMAALNINLGNGIYDRLNNGKAFAHLSIAAEQAGELRDMRREVAKLDEKAADIQSRLSESANEMTAYSDRMTRDMVQSHRSYRELIAAHKDVTANENGILAELGLTRADIERFTYTSPNSGDSADGIMSYNDPFNARGRGIDASFSNRTWYDIQLTDKDGQPIALTEEQKTMLRDSLQERDMAQGVYDITRKNSMNSQFYASEMRNEMNALLEEKQQLDEARATLRQEIKQSTYLSQQFGSYQQSDDARMTDEQQAFNDVREKMGIVHLTEAYARYRNENPPPTPNEGEKWTPESREARWQAFIDKNPEAAAGYMILMRKETPEFAAKIADDHPAIIAQIDRQIAISTHGISDDQVVDFIVETQAEQELSATQDNAEATQTASRAERTPSGIKTGVDVNDAFETAASGEEAAPRAPDMPAPRPQEQPMAAMM